MLIVIVVFILILAVYWEAKDYNRISKRPPISSVEKKDKLREYKFYACFNSENNVMWRNIYISSVLSIILIGFVLKTYHPDVTFSWKIYLVCIFLTFYISNHFRTFHLYRVMTSKIKPDLTIL